MRFTPTLAAIRSGTDPIGPLPEAAFHRWLEATLGCPRCDVQYNIVVPWDQATDRFFDETSRGPLRMLRRAIQMNHAAGHGITHFETSGVIVRSFTTPTQPTPPKP